MMISASEYKYYEEEVIRLRREFHKRPELGFEEWETQKFIISYLESLGLKPIEIAKTGVIADLICSEGKVLCLRADMDALPINEENICEYRSTNENVMHACGHDAHMAMLLVAAKILCKHKQHLRGRIRFLFQPNEEEAGAIYMIDDGALENPNVDAVLGIHVWSSIATGKIGISSGPVMGAMDIFDIDVYGRGGHTAMPQETVDPLYIGAQIILSSQAVQTRLTNPLDITSIVFSSMTSEISSNIIPNNANLKGTLRYMYDINDRKTEDNPRKIFERIVEKIAELYGGRASVKWTPSNSAVINDNELFKFMRDVAAKSLNDYEIIDYKTLAGEDFSEYARGINNKIPILLYFLGCGNSELGTNYPHHHPNFDIDESVLLAGVKMHVESAYEFLRES